MDECLSLLHYLPIRKLRIRNPSRQTCIPSIPRDVDRVCKIVMGVVERLWSDWGSEWM